MRNKTPYLTGFSTRLCGSAKTRAQARIERERRRLAQNTIADSARMFAPLLDAGFMESLRVSPRRQSYEESTTFWAWAGQILGGNASCTQAVGQVQTWCAESGRAVPSSNTAAYCIARARLAQSFLEGIHERLTAVMQQRQRACDLWHGMTLKAMDGSSVQLSDTDANQQAYPQPSVQKPGCGFPVMGLVGVLNLSCGAWLGAVVGPLREHDSRLAGEVLTHFGQGDLALADRAFNSYELVARLLARGTHSLMRLHQARHRKLDWRSGKRLSPHERLVVWAKPERQPTGSALDEAAWQALPDTLTLRYIRFGYENRGGDKSTMVLVTTLLDPKAHDWTELSDLYATRWEIELKLRDLKTTLRMERFDVRSPAMARKTLSMVIIAHNLIRAMIQRAALCEDVALQDMSFKASLDLLMAWRSRHRGRCPYGRITKELDAELLDLLGTKRVTKRPFRQEPRAVKRRPKPFAQLTSHRSEYQEIQHRSEYRKPA